MLFLYYILSGFLTVWKLYTAHIVESSQNQKQSQNWFVDISVKIGICFVVVVQIAQVIISNNKIKIIKSTQNQNKS